MRLGKDTNIKTTIGQSNTKTPFDLVLKNNFGADEVWPLVDISAGTTITAAVNSARNGTETGWALQNITGMVAGTKAPRSDGANDYGDIASASLTSIFDGNEGSLFGLAIVDSVSDWTDGVIRDMVRLETDTNNQIIVRKGSANNRLQFIAKAGGTGFIYAHTDFTTTAWFSYGMSWYYNAGGSSVLNYVNGAQSGAAQSSYGDWVGNPSSSFIGAATSDPTEIWNGGLSYVAVKFGSRWSAADMLAMHQAITTSGG